MESKIINENFTNSLNEGILVDLSKLKRLVEDMQESLRAGNCLDFYAANHRFSWLNRGRYNPFGYDSKKSKKERINISIFRHNRLRHKLVRIQKEIDFVNNNLKLYKALTPREKEIIQLLAKGYSNPEIAKRLFISRNTVEQHRKNINRKLQIKSLPHLLKYCYAFDLI